MGANTETGEHAPTREGQNTSGRGSQAVLVQLAERVVVLARRGHGEGAKDALVLSLDRFLDKLIHSGPTGAESLPQELRARLALSFSALLAGQDRELALSALFGLVRLGRFGAVLAAKALDQGTVPVEEGLPILAELSPGDLLTVADVLTRFGRGPCQDATRMLLPQAAEADLHQARQFLAHCKGRVPGPAQPLREVLWEGRLGRDIRQIDPARETPARLLAVAQWLKILKPYDPPNVLIKNAALHAGQETACRLLMASPALPGPDKSLGRLLSGLLTGVGPGQAGQCMAASGRLAPDKLSQVAAMLFHGRPTLRSELAGSLALMSQRGFTAFLSYLSPERRAQAVRATLNRVAQEDPAGLFAVAPEIFDAEVPAPLGVQVARLHLPPAQPVSRKPAASAHVAEDTQSKGFSLRGLLGMAGNRGKTELLAEEAWGRLQSHVFTGRDFIGESFLGHWLEDVHFLGCTFVGVTFKTAAFVRVRFSGCRFDGCDFRQAQLWQCVLERCDLMHCGFMGAEFSGCSLEQTAFISSVFVEARLHDATLRGIHFDGCDASGVAASGLTLTGVLVRNTLLDGARLWRITLASCRMEGVSAQLADAWDVDGDEPLLRRLSARTLKRALSSGSGPSAAGEDGKTAGQKLVEGLVESRALEVLGLWLIRQERLAGLRAFMAENLRRLEFGLGWLTPAQVPFVRLLPLLLHTQCFDQAMNLLPPAPSCQVAAYHPDPDVLALARTHFPAVALEQDVPALLVIEAVYTIGSFGTLAQTPGSDLDVWVCHRMDKASQADLDALDAKFSVLSAWAARTFGLETHFYRMDVDRVVANDFGVSHEEGSGSAQAMLLKEEFYRSAVLLAGKAPLWWAVPPGCGQEFYRTIGQDFGRRENLLDLGAISAIPKAEFFGAMLWQVFKSIKQPYKSVMKFALLERYLEDAGSAGNTGLLLCEAMKHSLLAGSRELWEIDPYARLFAEVYSHYQRQGRREEAALIRLAFLSKSGLPGKAQDGVQPLTAEQGQIRRMYFGKSADGPNFGGKDAGRILGWREQGKLGELFGRFIVRAYTRLTSQLHDFAGSVITPEDLTRIGRRIMAAFSKRKDKIEIMPFAEAHGHACQVVYFAATRGERNAYRWHIQAGQVKPGESRLDLVLTRDSSDLAAECAWLTANGVFAHGTLVNADYTINPVTAKDLQELLDALAAFFPHDCMFDTNTSLALSSEAVAKAFAVVNLCLPRENRAVQTISLIYLTTWGELFIKSMRIKGTPPFDPKALLNQCSGMPCVCDLQFAWLTPARAACPRPFEGDRGVEGTPGGIVGEGA